MTATYNSLAASLAAAREQGRRDVIDVAARYLSIGEFSELLGALHDEGITTVESPAEAGARAQTGGKSAGDSTAATPLNTGPHGAQVAG